LEAAHNALPQQAQEAHLAYIKTPPLDKDFGHDAAELLRQMALGKSMLANVEYRANNALYVSLGDRDSLVLVNAALLRAGLARVEKMRGKGLAALVNKQRQQQPKES
jgi:hypothetical protein